MGQALGGVQSHRPSCEGDGWLVKPSPSGHRWKEGYSPSPSLRTWPQISPAVRAWTEAQPPGLSEPPAGTGLVPLGLGKGQQVTAGARHR